MNSQIPYIERDSRIISGLFKYSNMEEKGTHSLAFRWDQAAIKQDGSIMVVEKELSNPVPLHIQGHVARATFMNSTEDAVSKLVWIVRKRHFSRLWKIVETWRNALKTKMSVAPPPCEYWTPDGTCLGISRDNRRPKTDDDILEERGSK